MERKPDGSSTSFMSFPAFLSPSSSILRSFAGLRDITAISVMAKKALIIISISCSSNCCGMELKNYLSFIVYKIYRRQALTQRRNLMKTRKKASAVHLYMYNPCLILCKFNISIVLLSSPSVLSEQSINSISLPKKLLEIILS